MDSIIDVLFSDSFFKYYLILTNFIIILIIMIYQKYYPDKDQDQKVPNLLLVTAHPDDETMFFRPLIEELNSTHNIHLLCFSNGDRYGLGKIRGEELIST